MPFRSEHQVASFPPLGRANPTVPFLSGEMQCGRCRRFFDHDSTPLGTRKEWWLCPSCRTALFGDYS
jgi:hypothetical protein